MSLLLHSCRHSKGGASSDRKRGLDVNMLSRFEKAETGGNADKPVGTVWFGWNVNGNITTATRRFDGDRAAVRQQTLAWACARLHALLQAPPPAPR